MTTLKQSAQSQQLANLKDYHTKYYAPGWDKEIPKNSRLSIGADIGIIRNRTVITAIDIQSRNQVFLWKFCPGDASNWWMNFDALAWTYRKFGVPLAVDCTGAGVIIPYEMQLRGVPLVEWGVGSTKMMWGNNKQDAFEHLRCLIDSSQVTLFDIVDQKRELKGIRWTATASGRIQIAGETAGVDDDIPNALAIACTQLETVHTRLTSEETIVYSGAKSAFATEDW